MVIWSHLMKFCGQHIDSTPTQGQIPFWDLEAITSWKNSKSMPTEDSRELKLVATATNDAFPWDPINFSTSLEFRVVSDEETIFDLKWCVVSGHNELVLELRECIRRENSSCMGLHGSPCFQGNVLEILLHCLLFSSLILKIHSNSYLIVKQCQTAARK